MGLFKIPRPIIKMKLTEFIKECQNDEALTIFLQKLLNVQKAHINVDDHQYRLIYSGQSQETCDAETIVEKIMSHYEELDVVRDTVMHVKSNYAYKERVITK